MSIFNNSIKDNQVLKNRAIDEYKIMMFKQGNFEFKFDDVPNLGINDKLSIKKYRYTGIYEY